MSGSCIDSGSTARERTVAVGDFNGDGWPDIWQVRTAQTDSTTLSVPITAQMYLNAAKNVTTASTISNCSGSQTTKSSTVIGDPTFKAPYSAMTTPSDTGSLPKEGSNVIVMDYNNDGKLDILIGTASGGGSIRILLNQCTLMNPQPVTQPATGPRRCANNPTFAFSTTLISNLDGSSNAGAFTTNSLPMFDYKDLDGDGLLDLIVSAPDCCTGANKRVRIFKGVAGGGVEAVASQFVVNGGGGVVMLLDDFSLDGKLDFMEGIDQNVNTANGFKGGDIYYWVNNGTSTPFSGVVPTPVPAPTKTYTQQIAANPTPETDWDMGFAIDYDNDPQHTPDMMLANGNGGHYDFYADRVANTYVPCGTVTSGVIDLGSLANSITPKRSSTSNLASSRAAASPTPVISVNPVIAATSSLSTPISTPPIGMPRPSSMRWPTAFAISTPPMSAASCAPTSRRATSIARSCKARSVLPTQTTPPTS